GTGEPLLEMALDDVESLPEAHRGEAISSLAPWLGATQLRRARSLLPRDDEFVSAEAIERLACRAAETGETELVLDWVREADNVFTRGDLLEAMAPYASAHTLGRLPEVVEGYIGIRALGALAVRAASLG